MNDYLSAIDDAANNLPYVDKDRLGCVGASFGGFWYNISPVITTSVSRHSSLDDGAFNLESMYTDTEEAWFSNWEYEDAYWNKDQSANAKKTYENSPHKFVDKVGYSNPLASTAKRITVSMPTRAWAPSMQPACVASQPSSSSILMRTTGY